MTGWPNPEAPYRRGCQHIERCFANDGIAGDQLTSRHRVPQRGRQYPGQGVDHADRRPIGSSLAFELSVASTAEPTAVASEALLHQDRGDVMALEEAETNASVVRTLPVEFAP